PVLEIDVILGMDWLSTYHAHIDCHGKRVEFKLEGQDSFIYQGDKSDVMSRMISTMAARRLLRKGCQGYLATVIDKRIIPEGVDQIPIVNEFPNVFPEELPGLPPEREIEFEIELQPGVSPISIPPYRLAPAELKELKVQLQDLIDKGFIRLSSS